MFQTGFVKIGYLGAPGILGEYGGYFEKFLNLTKDTRSLGNPTVLNDEPDNEPDAGPPTLCKAPGV